MRIHASRASNVESRYFYSVSTVGRTDSITLAIQNWQHTDVVLLIAAELGTIVMGIFHRV